MQSYLCLKSCILVPDEGPYVLTDQNMWHLLMTLLKVS